MCFPDMRRLTGINAVLASLLLTACASHPDMDTVDYVDLERYMGDWYVIANIPTFVEKGAHNAIENYALNPDGTIATTFTFRADSFDGKLKTYTPKGFVRDTETNALWGMQFIWPIKGEFRIVYLDDDYSTTVVGRSKRDFVWIMARTPTISRDELFERVRMLREQGYDTYKLKLLPQCWDGHDSNYSANIARRAAG